MNTDEKKLCQAANRPLNGADQMTATDRPSASESAFIRGYNCIVPV